VGLEQVVDNLLENAIKYSEPDQPVEVVLQGKHLSIRDRGIGMDENELLRVFERYYQSDSRKRGEGIGLSLVKRYCDENDIALKIRSRKGEGTEIFLYLDKVVSIG
jgi:signal transduction histidine kinase